VAIAMAPGIAFVPPNVVLVPARTEPITAVPLESLAALAAPRSTVIVAVVPAEPLPSRMPVSTAVAPP
jgi:hypothetical protein